VTNRSLATYLNNHVAGSVIALELLEQLKAEGDDAEEGATLGRLHAEISAERQTLEALMAELDITTSLPQQASAWLTEKMSEVKLRLDDPSGRALRRLESLEALSLGITGKTALWHSLAVAAETAPELARLDYAQLIKQSQQQFDVVEHLRLEAAREALGNQEPG
jgi:hypothetical protein